jgi:flagellar hook-basal body complex protein FliE
MPGAINPISSIPMVDSIRPAGAPRSGGAFEDVLSSAIRTVESFGQDASASVERFLSGDGEEIHTTVLAAQRAELSFDLFLQARNKVVSAYQEIMRMQV